MNDEEFFKQCPMCRKTWKNRDAFLDDGSLRLEGYSAYFDTPEKGLLYFTHRVDGCFSTMAFEATVFLSLYTGIRYADSKMGTDECLRLCLDRQKIDRCTSLCKFAFIREILQIIKERQQNGKTGEAPDTAGRV